MTPADYPMHQKNSELGFLCFLRPLVEGPLIPNMSDLSHSVRAPEFLPDWQWSCSTSRCSFSSEFNGLPGRLLLRVTQGTPPQDLSKMCAGQSPTFCYLWVVGQLWCVYMMCFMLICVRMCSVMACVAILYYVRLFYFMLLHVLSLSWHFICMFVCVW